MSDSCLRLYEPINRLKPVAENVWIVDGPEIRMRYGPLRMPFSTRMTVIRLPDGRIWVHSPVAPEPELCRDVAALGPVAFLISPNRLHYAWLAAWRRAFPGAVTAGVASQLAWDGTPLDVDFDLGSPGPFPWSESIGQRLVTGGVFSEAVFCHLPTRTLVLTDLIENFELDRVTCLGLRLLLRATGPLDPHGTAPPDMRFSFRRHRPALRAALAQMRAWAPERIILAHGRWYPSDGMRELERAFRWVG